MNRLVVKTSGICVKKDVAAEEILSKNVPFELKNASYHSSLKALWLYTAVFRSPSDELIQHVQLLSVR